MSEQQHIKGACTHCNGRIEFPATAVGSTITCPHCGQSTPLLPPPPVPAAGMSKCACRHCQGRIEFPVAAAGMSIACPHCGQQTVLVAAGAVAMPVPPRPPAAPPIPPPPPPPPSGPSKPVSVQDAMSSALDEIQEAGNGGLTDRKAKAGGKGKRLIIGLVVLVLAGGAGGYYYVKTHPQSPPAQRSGKDLEVLNYSLQKAKDGGLVYVVGTLTNHAPSQYFTLRVEFDLFDKSTNKVGNTSDYYGNLGPTSVWSFKALVLEENATEAKLVKVLGEADTAVPDSAKKDDKTK